MSCLGCGASIGRREELCPECAEVQDELLNVPPHWVLDTAVIAWARRRVRARRAAGSAR
jgi:hypothetical protein